MSARAGDVVEAMWAAFATGDAEAGFAFFGPEVAWHGTVGGLTEGDELRGHGTVVEGFADMIQEWASFVVELCGVLEAGENQAIAFFREVATGRVSGLETTTHSALLFTVASGTIVRARPFLDGG